MDLPDDLLRIGQIITGFVTERKNQDAIDASTNGDTVLLASGVYVERITFAGKQITVRGSQGADLTYIDPQGSGGPVVTFESGETLESVLEDVNIRDATGRGGCHHRVPWHARTTDCRQTSGYRRTRKGRDHASLLLCFGHALVGSLEGVVLGARAQRQSPPAPAARWQNRYAQALW